MHYLEKSVQDYIEAAVKAIFQIHYRMPPGDILVFLAGQDDIESLRSQLESYLPTMDHNKPQLLICPLYARLTPGEQDKAFNIAPPNTRKIILATNVAETSITISGITYVIDTGFAKEKTYHPNSGIDSLLLSPISKSSAMQRAGRAGREVMRFIIDQMNHQLTLVLIEIHLPSLPARATGCTPSSTIDSFGRLYHPRFSDAVCLLLCCT